MGVDTEASRGSRTRNESASSAVRQLTVLTDDDSDGSPEDGA
jgi:hypothetical protein